MGKLSDFEGTEVIGVGIEMPGAAGGLREALKVDPDEWHKGEPITVALRCRVEKIRHDPVKDTDAWRRVHILAVDEAAIIDDELVAEALDLQAKRIEEAAGVRRLELADEAKQAHQRGEHKRFKDDCELCQEEAEAAEAAEG